MHTTTRFAGNAWKNFNWPAAVPSGLLLLCLAAGNSAGQTYTVLHSFAGGVDGAYPGYAQLVLAGTTLYGTAGGGGTSNRGIVFKLNTDGSSYTVLKSFTLSDGGDPEGTMVLSGSTLYGTTYQGGSSNAGTVFTLQTDGSGYTLLKQFTRGDGVLPCGGLVLSNGTLYGTTVGGGDFGYGTVFKLGTNGNDFKVLHSFGHSVEGYNPFGGLVLAGNVLYGTTSDGYSNGGTIYRINTDGSGFTVLHTLPASSGNIGPIDGLQPFSPLVLSGTTLYGTAALGGSFGKGTLFRLNTDGTDFNVLRHFNGLGDGAGIAAGLLLCGSTLYGTAADGGDVFGHGTVFRINTDGSGFMALKLFSGGDGASPTAGLVGFGTTLFGMTGYGGGADCGVIFSLSVPPPTAQKPLILSSPGDQTLGTGSDVTLSVTAFGSLILAYQWCFNQTNLINGATNALLQLTNLQLAQSGLYSVIVTNDFGSVTSASARLQVLELAPSIVAQPTGCTAIVEASADFSVSATGSAPLSYQWYFNQTNALAGVVGSILHNGDVQFSDAGIYTVVVTNAFGVVTSSPAALVVIPHVTNVVTSLADSGSGSLRQAIANAAPVDTVAFSVTGTITLTSGELWIGKSLSILGPGAAALTVSGHGVSRIFTVGTNSNVLISDLTLRDGRARDGVSYSGKAEPGGALTNAGSLVLRNCALLNNHAGNGWTADSGYSGGPGAAAGAIYSVGALSVSNCSFSGNAAGTGGSGYATTSGSSLASQGGAGGPGGAIYSVGTLSVSNCSFSGNGAGNGGPPGAPSPNEAMPGGAGGSGGAIYSVGTVYLEGSSFSNNSTGSGRHLNQWGGELPGNNAGSGGGIYSTGILTASGSVFIGNSTGSGGYGIAHNDWGSPGGSGGNGGAVCGLGQVSLTSCSVSDNACGAGGHGGNVSWPFPASGGAGGQGGYGGGIFATTNLTLVGCTLSSNRTGPAGTNGYPGSGSGPGGPGGAIYSDGFLWMTNCTATGNWSTNGGSGGAVYCAYGTSTVAVVCCTVVSNAVGLNGSGEGIYSRSYRPGGFLDNIIAGSVSRTQDVCGVFNSLGHNLIGATNGSSGFTSTGDLVGSAAAPLDPLVGPLTNNSGPTLTTALLPGSPAIDAGSAVGAPTTDQRGFTRPYGPAVDIGAYEYAPYFQHPPFTYITNNGAITIIGYTGTNGAVRIPDTLDGLPVTSIGTAAFQSAHSLTSVAIPNSVINIGDLAFAGCGNLTSVYFRGNAPAIASGVFALDTNATVYYLAGATGWGQSFGDRPTAVWALPTVLTPPQTQTAEASSSVRFQVRADGDPVVGLEWYFNGTNGLSCTNRTLQLTNIQPSDAGAYTAVAANAGASVTSTPALLSVIAPVPRRIVPALTFTGPSGSSLNLDSREALDSAAAWATFDAVSLTSTSQWYFDVRTPLPAERFYRTWTMDPLSPPSPPGLHMVPAITLTGAIGNSLRLDCINQIGPTDVWWTLDTVTLTNTSQLYFDTSSIGQPARLWRIVPVP